MSGTLRTAVWVVLCVLDVTAGCVLTLLYGTHTGRHIRSAVVPGPPQALAPLTLDLAAGHMIRATAVPGSNGEVINFIDGPRDVDFRLPGGRRFRYRIESGQVRGKQNEVRNIHLVFPVESPAAAQARAAALIREWGLKGEPQFTAWAAQQPGRSAGGDTATWASDEADRTVPIAVDVWTGNSAADKWAVGLGIGFDPPVPMRAFRSNQPARRRISDACGRLYGRARPAASAALL